MAEPEKMVALKKAYADMILNTAKEAASRVMASERKALRFQHDLFAAKNEAFRLLLHLKQMIDAKAIEAEMSSSSQQTKIDELEAQLQEAEGVTVDLRAELKSVRNKLEKVRNPLNGKIIGAEVCYQDAKRGSDILSSDSRLQALTTYDTNNRFFYQRNLDAKYSKEQQVEHLSVSQFGSHTSHDAEFVSVSIRNKEPELHRNDCTQRIPAVDKDLLAGKLPPMIEFDENSFRKCESKGSSDDHGKFTLPLPMTKKNFTHSSRRRTRFHKPKTKYRSCPSQLMKPYHRHSILSRCLRYLGKANAISDDCSLPSIKTDSVDMKKQLSKMEKELHSQNTCTVDEKMSLHEGNKQRKVHSRDSLSLISYPDQHETCQPLSLLIHCNTGSLTRHGNVKLADNQSRMSENEVKMKPLPRLDPGLTLIKGGVDPISGSTNITVSVKALNRSDVLQNTANKGVELVDELVKQEHKAAANTTFPCHDSNPHIVNVPVVYSDLEDLKASAEGIIDVSILYSDPKDAKASNETKTSSLPDSNRLLKYTFQRKRKREASDSPDKHTCLEKSTVKRRAEDQHNGSAELQKSGNDGKSEGKYCSIPARRKLNLMPI